MPTDQLDITPQVTKALESGAALAISISGGKDSQALLAKLVAFHREHSYTGELFAIHADLGRAEWSETPAHVRAIAAAAGVRLVVVRRNEGRGKWDMVDRWQQRGETLRNQGKKPRPWSDAGNRFCTAELKRNPIDKYLRQYTYVVCAMGLRAQESPARAKKSVSCWRMSINNSRRLAIDWNPILSWGACEVWRACGTTWIDVRDRQALYASGRTEEALEGFTGHPAYVYGNERLSCAFCVLGSQNDLTVGKAHNPELYAELVGMEKDFGFDFQNKRPLASI